MARVEPSFAGGVGFQPVDRESAEPMPPAIAALRETAQPVWIFGYGSLMWNPEVPCAEMRPAWLYGWHRSFCLYSYDYRGTAERPGLVLGLDRGGACRGMALRLDRGSLAASLDHLWRREMTGGAYEMRPVTLRLDGGTAAAHAFVVRRAHPDYAGRLSLEEAARLIATAAGGRGRCRDYLASTLAHLDALGLGDRRLRRLHPRVEALAAAGPARPSSPAKEEGDRDRDEAGRSEP